MKKLQTWLLIVFSAGLAAAIAATIVSGYVHIEHSFVDSNFEPPTTRGTYGWPFDWRSSDPAWLREATQADDAWCVYGTGGVDSCKFVASTAVWLVIMVPVIALLSLTGWLTLRQALSTAPL